jgi:type VI secretion system secreted protein Hcp
MAIDNFLLLEGIQGESLDAEFKGQMELSSWTWGAVQQGSFSSNSGGGVGKVSMRDFDFVMPVNKACPKLFLACANGEHVKKAVLTCRKAGKEAQKFMIVTFTDCLVSSIKTAGSEGSDGLPTVQVSLNFAAISWEYKEQKADGTLGGAVKTGWDLKANKVAA